MPIVWKENKRTETTYIDGSFVRRERPTYDGAVIGQINREVRVMSDVWAIGHFAEVWTGSEVRLVAVGDCEFGDYGTIVPDATPEALAAASQWKARREEEKREAERRERARREEERAKVVAKGKRVIVARGRKVPKGIEGVVFWLGLGKWGHRAGIKTKAGDVHWIAAANLDVVNWRDFLPSWAR